MEDYVINSEDIVFEEKKLKFVKFDPRRIPITNNLVIGFDLHDYQK